MCGRGCAISRFAAQSATLVANAAEAMTHPLLSVVSSPYPPPNGDLHLYYSVSRNSQPHLPHPLHSSQRISLTPSTGFVLSLFSRQWAPYWNPVPSCNLSDPTYMTSCNFTNLDGIINPDVTLATQVRSLANVSSDSFTLALIGAHTSDPTLLQRAALNLRLFYLDPNTLMAPDFRYAQVQRGANQPQPWVGRQYGIIDGRAQLYALQASAILLNHSHLSGWTAVDHRALDGWFSRFTHWLNTSTFGVDERDAPNNHGSWWQVQGLSYAWRLGRIAEANATLSLWLGNQFQGAINASGEQPLEAVRVRPFHYRCYHLQAMLYIASVAQQLGVDVFHLQNAQGGSLQRAIDFVLERVTPQEGTEDPTEFVPLLYTAIDVYGDDDGKYAKGITKFGGNLKQPPFWTIWKAATPGQGRRRAGRQTVARGRERD